MYITAHPLDRVFPPDFQHAQGWPGHVATMLPGTPLAWWAGAQLGASAGYVVAAWDDEAGALAAAGVEGATSSRVTVNPASRFHLDAVELSAGRALTPGVMQLTWFAGPRSEAHRRADDLMDARIAVALRDLPGLCGAVICSTPQNARLIVSFADSEATLRAALARVMATTLGPDEDPALLQGPESVQICTIVDGTGPLAVLGDQAPDAISHARPIGSAGSVGSAHPAAAGGGVR